MEAYAGVVEAQNGAEEAQNSQWRHGAGGFFSVVALSVVIQVGKTCISPLITDERGYTTQLMVMGGRGAGFKEVVHVPLPSKGGARGSTTGSTRGQQSGQKKPTMV
jgi:hypothetical protein